MQLGTWIDALPEKTVVDVCERFSSQIAGASEVELDAAVAGLPPELREDAEFIRLWDHFADEYYTKLPPALSVPLARDMLHMAAASPALASALAAFARDYRDEDQFALEVLAIGAAISMVIITATTSAEMRIGEVTVTKHTATPAQIKAAGNWLDHLKSFRAASQGRN